MTREIGMHDPSRVFLVGCPRSGTTLLQALLGAHRDVASFPESHIFIKGRRRAARFAPGLVARRNLQRFVRVVDGGDIYKKRAIYLRSQPYQLDLIHLLDEITSHRQKRLWIEKTPNHVLAIPEIRKMVPSSRFIHLVRDGRAVVASLYQVTRSHPAIWGGVMSLEQCISEWNKAIVAASRAMETGSDGIVVHYQSLTADPGIEVQRLCQFLNISYEPQMLTGYIGVTTSIVNSEEAWKSGVGEPIRDSGLNKYFELFSSKEQEFIQNSLVSVPRSLGDIVL